MDKEFLKTHDDQVEEPTFTNLTGSVGVDLSSSVNTDVNLAALGDVSDGSLSITVDGSNILLQENLVLLGTSKGLVLSVSDAVNALSSMPTTVASDDTGRLSVSSAFSLPASLFSHIQHVGLVDGAESLVYETSPDVGVSSTSPMFEDGDSSGIQKLQLVGEMTVPSGNHVTLETGDNTILKLPVEGNIPVPILTMAGSDQVQILDPVRVSDVKRKRGGGWPKGKKRKDVPTVTAPKKPVTGYVLFAIKRRKEIKEAHPEYVFADVTKILGHEWSAMPHETKQKYLELAESDKARYIQEMKAFQQSDTYQNFIKNRRVVDVDGNIVDDTVGSLIDIEGNEGMDELFCKVCNQFFISIHNKKEHMFGRQHLEAITSEIQKTIQQQTELQKQETMAAASINSIEQIPTMVCLPESTVTCSTISTDTLDIDGFIHNFMYKNAQRDKEIHRLWTTNNSLEEENLAMSRQCKELEELETKLDHDLGNLKAFGASLSAQIDALKMVPTVFGVINF